MRSFTAESLEQRVMLHADVNLDFSVTALDALTVINYLDREQPVLVADYHALDVNRDGRVTALDALNVINYLHRMTEAHPIVMTFSLGSIDTYGLSDDEVRWAINEAFEEYEQVANLDMRVQSSGQFVIASSSLWLGGPYHARGQLLGNQILFHSGILYPGQHDGTINGDPNQTAYWYAFRTPQALKQVVMHEIGHTIFGTTHSDSTSCVMHINASTDHFCRSEAATLTSRYGVSQIRG